MSININYKEKYLKYKKKYFYLIGNAPSPLSSIAQEWKPPPPRPLSGIASEWKPLPLPPPLPPPPPPPQRLLSSIAPVWKPLPPPLHQQYKDILIKINKDILNRTDNIKLVYDNIKIEYDNIRDISSFKYDYQEIYELLPEILNTVVEESINIIDNPSLITEAILKVIDVLNTKLIKSIKHKIQINKQLIQESLLCIDIDKQKIIITDNSCEIKILNLEFLKIQSHINDVRLNSTIFEIQTNLQTVSDMEKSINELITNSIDEINNITIQELKCIDNNIPSYLYTVFKKFNLQQLLLNYNTLSINTNYDIEIEEIITLIDKLNIELSSDISKLTSSQDIIKLYASDSLLSTPIPKNTDTKKIYRLIIIILDDIITKVSTFGMKKSNLDILKLYNESTNISINKYIKYKDIIASLLKKYILINQSIENKNRLFINNYIINKLLDNKVKIESSIPITIQNNNDIYNIVKDIVKVHHNTGCYTIDILVLYLNKYLIENNFNNFIYKLYKCFYIRFFKIIEYLNQTNNKTNFDEMRIHVNLLNIIYNLYKYYTEYDYNTYQYNFNKNHIALSQIQKAELPKINFFIYENQYKNVDFFTSPGIKKELDNFKLKMPIYKNNLNIYDIPIINCIIDFKIGTFTLLNGDIYTYNHDTENVDVDFNFEKIILKNLNTKKEKNKIISHLQRFISLYTI